MRRALATCGVLLCSWVASKFPMLTCMFMFLTRMDSSNYEILPVVSVSLTPKVLRSADSGKDGINEGEQLALLSTTPTTLSSRSLCLLDCAFARKAVTDI